jgi:hypothetical protein
MPILFTRKLISLACVLSLAVQAATVSRVTSFSDGEVLFAADLESEFNNLVDNINTLDNDNIASGANISPVKLSATIAGDGIARNGSTGILEVNDDNSTIEISGDVLRVKDDGITVSKIAEQVALSVLGNGTNSTANVTALAAGTDGHVLRRSGTAVAFGELGASTVGSSQIVDGSISAGDIGSDAVTTVKILNSNVTTAKIADGNVTNTKLAAKNLTVSSSSGLFSTTSTLANVTNLSAAITTSGRPVRVFLTSASGSSGCVFRATAASGSPANAFSVVLRDGSPIAIFDLTGQTVTGSAGSIGVPCSSISFLDQPGAGTYTYSIQVGHGGSHTLVMNYTKLVVMEE